MKTKLCILVWLIIFLVGCSANLFRNAKKIAVVANETYIEQYDDYMTFFSKDENEIYQLKLWVTDSQRVALRERKKRLVKLDELTDTLNAFIAIGYLPPGQTLPQLESEIITLVRRLGGQL